MSESIRIEELRKEIEKLCGNCDRPDKEELGKIILSSMALGFNEGLKVSSADRPQEWIPCSERFPKEEGIYLVTATNYIFDTDEIVVGTCYFNIEYGFSNNRKILAWMPLPKPWKGADDEDN